MTSCTFQQQTNTLTNTTCHLLLINCSAYFWVFLWFFLPVSLVLAECVKATKDSRRMDAKEETLGLLNRIWVKLQGLPNASPIELGAFFILLMFILMVLLMTVLTCVICCCCRKTKLKGSNI